MTWVRLNVGGQTFEASLETLIKFPMSELAKMFQSESDEDQNLMTTGEKVNTNNNVYNLDLDPQAFSVVLSWLRYGVLSLPADLHTPLVKATAEKLGLEELAKEISSKESAARNSLTDWLKLNVGGTVFETSRTTLTSDPDSFLSRMFEPNSNLPPASISDGVFRIDACPRSFSVILNWLRYRCLILGEAKVQDVLAVADYFGLKDLKDELERQVEREKNEESRLVTCIEESVERLEEVLQHIECELSGINDKLDDIKIEVSSVATGVEDVWRIKCELSSLCSIISNGLLQLK